jgi:excisionase family DNA binding protein
MDTLMRIELYTAEQVATLMGCSVKTVEAMARDGDLPGIKPGGSWIFPSGALASQLDALALEQSRARKAPKPPTATTQASYEGKEGGRRRKALPVLVDLR